VDRALPMPSDRVATTILEHIDLARGFVGALNSAQFEGDMLRFYATVRCLEIISEASRRLPNDLKERHPEIEWPKMAAAGNFYRHNYDNVTPAIVWATVRQTFSALQDALAVEAAR
jgi:uncharacterized protein with HEPN domain